MITFTGQIACITDTDSFDCPEPPQSLCNDVDLWLVYAEERITEDTHISSDQHCIDLV